MIKLYGSASCNSCRKAQAWLEAQEVNFEARDIIINPLAQQDLADLLALTETGTEEIIATRSKVYHKFTIDFNELSLEELTEVITDNPGLLKRPIITDGVNLQIGYNEAELQQFVAEAEESKQSTEILYYWELEQESLV
ncbi:transcriptional regulator Spx [Enterococcus pseudoavium]|uniref:Transcriptional regulator Spx n=1 Tax=Enterococcus pseudoavium TaxID=44007 RepID=A0ABU3FER5_9ENTE|nr:transcriptional regulator Spx [Enterococcus pseudoavium]MDT2754417.1 transcriptional regulator Spx [Enterococcus pseudoavium]MDT2769527.1 transcriptional regulator Spx [Enterococcus pseudoavium]